MPKPRPSPNTKVNSLKFALAFIPVEVGLVFLTVYGHRVLPEYLTSAIVGFLFIALFLIFYRWRWLNPNPPPLPMRRLLLALALFPVALTLIYWINLKFPRSPALLTLLMMAGGLAWYFWSQKKGAEMRRLVPLVARATS